MVGVATAAAVVASQALISGAFSLTRQAVQLGLQPPGQHRPHVHSEIGQIYIPAGQHPAHGSPASAWWSTFRSADQLAATYGVALSGTMTITSILFAVVARRRWGWAALEGGRCSRALFLVVDLAFVGRQPAQDPARRLVPAGRGRPGLRADVHLEEGPDPAGGDRAREHAADGPVPVRHRSPEAAPGPRHGRLPHLGSERRAAGAAAPPEAQPGAAREGDPALDPHRGDPAGGSRTTGCSAGSWARASSR